jgi:Ca2+-binding RTX toxin-like protein
MNTITSLFQQAQLAEAAYANLSSAIGSQAALKQALDVANGGSFSTAQATAFAAQWRVVSQFTESSVFGLLDGNGFSATLFESLDANGNGTGQYTFAARGSTLNSLAVDFTNADLSLATGGVARAQLLSMVNYVLRLKAGPSYNAFQVVDNGDTIAFSPTMVTGIGPGINPAQLTISGHSLGGALAQMYQRIFGSVAVNTFNTVGIGEPNALLFNQLTTLLGLTTGSFGSGTGNNLVVLGEPAQHVGTIQGQAQQQVFSETANQGLYDAHRMMFVTDSLAVYNLFATLDPSLNTASTSNLDKITNLLKASSNVAANSLEYTLDTLRTLLQTDYTSGSANLLSPATAIDNREAFYANLKSLTDTLAASSFNLGTAQAPQYGFTLLTLGEAAHLGSNAIPTAEALTAIAKTDLATRYAFYQGNTFVLDATGYDLYTTINANGALDLYDPATQSGQLTDPYLKDRAAFVLAKQKANTDDTSNGDYAWAKQGDEEILYLDKIGSGLPDYATAKVYASSYLGNIGNFNNIKQIQFGSILSDTLTGGNKADDLFGGAGDDILTGGKGNDYLEGGKGSDIYQFTNGDGIDTILDTDGNGSIQIEGKDITGGTQYGDNTVFRGKDANGVNHLYTFVTGDRTTGGDLIVDGAMLIKDYQPNTGNHLGITLADAVVQANPVTTKTFVGDPLIHTATIVPGGQGADWHVTRSYNQQYTAVDDGNGNMVDVLTAYDVDYYIKDIATGNSIEGGGSARPDTLIGSTANDHITSGADNDTINATQGGDDILDGGTGRDMVNAGAGKDILIGGADGDILSGGAGDDQLYADAQISAATAIALGKVQTGTGLQGDWLSGGSGDDTLIGSAANDVLAGGGGSDLLIAGAGDDNILGDHDWITNDFNWSVSPSSVFTPATGNPVPGDAAADVIYAGNGNDHVWGEFGNDMIFGEGGNDVLQGNAGNDILLGGAGADRLYGEGQPTDLAGNDYLDGGAGNDTGNQIERYTSRISSFFPHAAAYLRSVATEGDCLSLANEASKRETAGGLVPMRSAICAWVKPDASRAVNSASSKANSSRSIRSTAWRNAASFIQLFNISSCDTVAGTGDFCLAESKVLRMIHLLFTSSGNLQITLGRGLGFFNEAVQHHNAPLMCHTIKHTGNTIRTFQAQLKQPTTHRTRMWHSKIRTKLLHPFGISGIASPHLKRQTCHIKTHGFAEIMDGEHAALLTDMLIKASPICAANDVRYQVSERKVA